MLYKVITLNIVSLREAITSQLHDVAFNVQHLHASVWTGSQRRLS